MKKVKITLLAAVLLLGAAPASQAAFVAQPHAISVASNTAGTTTEVSTPAAAASSEAASFTKVATAKKKSFFGKLKALLAADKSQLTAIIICLLVGNLGIHRFYMGYTWQGIVQLLTLGGFGIWTLIDLIRLLTGGLQPKDGGWDREL